MNLAEVLRVAARGSALPVSYRGIGSANGSRTRLAYSRCVAVRANRLILLLTSMAA